MGIESRTIGTATAYWMEPEDGDARSVAPDTTTYRTYRPEDDPRLYCDNCAACLVWKCGGITARHHFIHINEFEYFKQSDDEFEQGLLPNSSHFKHPDRDSRL